MAHLIRHTGRATGILTTAIAAVLLAASLASSTSLAQTTLWSEDFEGSWTTDWHVDAGTWEVGDATSGPASCQDGSACAATVLAGNYADGVNTRLIRHTQFVVPSGEKPRLRFWHWYSFSAADSAEVQISTDNGSTWESLSITYGGTSSAVWSRTRVGLDAYAGQSVILAFNFHSINSGGGSSDVSTGWYVDDVTVESGSENLNNPETFESDLNAWFVESGTWEVGSPTSGPSACNEGSSCAATVLAGNYHDSIHSRLISPPFIVPAAGVNPALRFWHWFSLSAADSAEVQITVDGGVSWTTISNLFSGTGSGAWSNYFVSLGAYAQESVRLAFNFRSINSGGGSADVSSGWYIDGVSIDGLNSAGAVLSVNPQSIAFESVLIGESDTTTVTVSNPGTEDLEVTSVALTGTDPLQFGADTRTFTLAPNESRDVEVSFTPTSGGAKSAALTLESNVGSVNIALSGTAPGSAVLSVNPLSIDFQAIFIGATATTQIDVTNTGSEELSVTSVVLGGTASSQFDAANATFTLAANESHGISVSFIPTEVGTFAATVTIESNAGTSEVTLAGQADSGVANEADDEAIAFAVATPYPNPAAAYTVLNFDLPNPAAVVVSVYDFLGREMQRVDAGRYSAGRNHRLSIDLDTQSSGSYVVRFTANSEVGIKTTTRMITVVK